MIVQQQMFQPVIPLPGQQGPGNPPGQQGPGNPPGPQGQQPPPPPTFRFATDPDSLAKYRAVLNKKPDEDIPEGELIKLALLCKEQGVTDQDDANAIKVKIQQKKLQDIQLKGPPKLSHPNTEIELGIQEIDGKKYFSMKVEIELELKDGTKILVPKELITTVRVPPEGYANKATMETLKALFLGYENHLTGLTAKLKNDPNTHSFVTRKVNNLGKKLLSFSLERDSVTNPLYGHMIDYSPESVRSMRELGLSRRSILKVRGTSSSTFIELSKSGSNIHFSCPELDDQREELKRFQKEARTQLAQRAQIVLATPQNAVPKKEQLRQSLRHARALAEELKVIQMSRPANQEEIAEPVGLLRENTSVREGLVAVKEKRKLEAANVRHQKEIDQLSADLSQFLPLAALPLPTPQIETLDQVSALLPNEQNPYRKAILTQLHRLYVSEPLLDQNINTLANRAGLLQPLTLAQVTAALTAHPNDATLTSLKEMVEKKETINKLKEKFVAPHPIQTMAQVAEELSDPICQGNPQAKEKLEKIKKHQEYIAANTADITGASDQGKPEEERKNFEKKINKAKDVLEPINKRSKKQIEQLKDCLAGISVLATELAQEFHTNAPEDKKLAEDYAALQEFLRTSQSDTFETSQQRFSELMQTDFNSGPQVLGVQRDPIRIADIRLPDLQLQP